MKIYIYKIFYYVYAIYFSTSDKYYIGITDNLDRRMLQHIDANSFVGKKLDEYDEWKISILHTVVDRNLALLLEMMEIWNYNCIKPNGYNQTKGGEGGDTCSGKKNLEHSKRMQGNKNAHD